MKKKILSIAIAGIACVAFTSKAATLSGPIVNPANGHLYYLLPQDTWTGSQATATGLGGALVTINNAAENQWVFDTFSSYGAVNRLLWTGLYDPSQANPSSPSSFQWVSGDSATYRNWSAGEPSAFLPTEFYVYMYPNGYNTRSMEHLQKFINGVWLAKSVAVDADLRRG